MNKLSVKTLNEVFNVDGPDWIDFSYECISEKHTCPPVTAFKIGHTLNLGRPTSELQKQKARENAIKRNVNQKGSNNRNAKLWRIVYEDGREVIIGGLQRWAVDNGYSVSGIKCIAYGKWKRYKDLVTVEKLSHQDSWGVTLDPIITR